MAKPKKPAAVPPTAAPAPVQPTPQTSQLFVVHSSVVDALRALFDDLPHGAVKGIAPALDHLQTFDAVVSALQREAAEAAAKVEEAAA